MYMSLNYIDMNNLHIIETYIGLKVYVHIYVFVFIYLFAFAWSHHTLIQQPL
jgi:hypothetical protein